MQLTGTLPCNGNFNGYTDVSWSDYFCAALVSMTDSEAVSGYSDGTFRPYNNVTRGQFAKMIVEGFGWYVIKPPYPTFVDVPENNPFWPWIETAYSRGIISGYNGNGTTINPCTGLTEYVGGLYFRWCNNVIRGQMIKMTTLAAGFSISNLPQNTPFQDVPLSDTYFKYVRATAMRALIVQWPPALPDPPFYCSSKPCFWPYANAGRADAVMHIFAASHPRDYGQVFSEKKGTWTLIAANATAPSANYNIAPGSTDFIATPIGVSSNWNYDLAEGGAYEYWDNNKGDLAIQAYFSWHNRIRGNDNENLGYFLNFQSSYKFQLTNIGSNRWKIEYCPSTCNYLGTSDPLESTPFAVAGVETGRLDLNSGSVYISYFYLQPPGAVTCYDPTLYPWYKMHSLPPSSCYNGSWSATYTP